MLRRIVTGAATLVVLLIGAVLVLPRFADGPMGPLAGGSFRTGTLVSEPNVDWSFMDGGREIELQLVEPPRSRVTGALVHEGQLYVPCDLGFLWRRVSSAGFRLFARGLYTVKGWHEDAQRDGRAVVRVSGKRYERQAVRVTDPALLATLRSSLEQRGRVYLEPIGGLSEEPGDPEAIWFFRMDPRPSATGGPGG
jgi:hypothetical protein